MGGVALCIVLGMRLIVYCQINFTDTFVTASPPARTEPPSHHEETRQGAAVRHSKDPAGLGNEFFKMQNVSTSGPSIFPLWLN